MSFGFRKQIEGGEGRPESQVFSTKSELEVAPADGAVYPRRKLVRDLEEAARTKAVTEQAEPERITEEPKKRKPRVEGERARAARELREQQERQALLRSIREEERQRQEGIRAAEEERQRIAEAKINEYRAKIAALRDRFQNQRAVQMVDEIPDEETVAPFRSDGPDEYVMYPAETYEEPAENHLPKQEGLMRAAQSKDLYGVQPRRFRARARKTGVKTGSKVDNERYQAYLRETEQRRVRERDAAKKRIQEIDEHVASLQHLIDKEPRVPETFRRSARLFYSALRADREKQQPKTFGFSAIDLRLAALDGALRAEPPNHSALVEAVMHFSPAFKEARRVEEQKLADLNLVLRGKKWQ